VSWLDELLADPTDCYFIFSVKVTTEIS